MEKLVVEYDRSTSIDDCGNFVTEAIEYESKEKFLADIEQAAKNQYLIGKAQEQRCFQIHEEELNKMLSESHRWDAMRKAIARIQQLNLPIAPYNFQLGNKEYDAQYFYDYTGTYHPPQVYILEEWFDLNK